MIGSTGLELNKSSVRGEENNSSLKGSRSRASSVSSFMNAEEIKSGVPLMSNGFDSTTTESEGLSSMKISKSFISEARQIVGRIRSVSEMRTEIGRILKNETRFDCSFLFFIW